MDISNIMRQIGQFASKNSPALLTATAAVGVVSTAILAARGSTHATIDILNEEAARGESLSVKEQVELTWQYYIPAVGVGAATIACVVGAHTISSRKNAALVTAYTVTERAFADYKRETRKQVGEKRESDIHDAAIDRRLSERAPSGLVLIEGEDVLCYETLTDRYFKSTPEKIRRAELKSNARLVSGADFSCSLNEFHTEIGLNPTALGDELGWNADCPLSIKLSSHLVPETDRPAIAVSYEKPPFPRYYGVRP